MAGTDALRDVWIGEAGLLVGPLLPMADEPIFPLDASSASEDKS